MGNGACQRGGKRCLEIFKACSGHCLNDKLLNAGVVMMT